MSRLRVIVTSLALLSLTGCATEGTGGSADFYGGMYYYDDWWYGGGCCVDYPGDIGPPGPHPEHPIALPPGGPRPEQPIATPPRAEVKPSASSVSRSMPSPRAAAPMGGGMRGGGGRR